MVAIEAPHQEENKLVVFQHFTCVFPLPFSSAKLKKYINIFVSICMCCFMFPCILSIAELVFLTNHKDWFSSRINHSYLVFINTQILLCYLHRFVHKYSFVHPCTSPFTRIQRDFSLWPKSSTTLVNSWLQTIDNKKQCEKKHNLLQLVVINGEVDHTNYVVG